LLALAAALCVGACVTSAAELESPVPYQAAQTPSGGLLRTPPPFLDEDEGAESPGLLLAPNWPALARDTGARASAERALLTTKLVLDRAGAILAHGREFGESRVACNALWFSDVDAGRIIADATIARLHTAALNSVRAEVAALPAENAQPDAAICAAEAASLRAAPEALR
jgi:hypothetical protein